MKKINLISYALVHDKMRFLYLDFITAIFVFMIFVFPSQAQRTLFGQDPNTIIGIFGDPPQRIVGWKTQVYIYQPPELKKLFPDFSNLKFSIIFQDNQLTSITLIFDPNDLISTMYEKGYNYDQEIAQQFFTYLFNDQSTTWYELSSTFTGNETIYDYQYCLGKGVANSFTRYGIAQMTDYVIWYYDSQCQ